MNTESMNNVKTYRTSFGQYVPCDRETYRKLKRIRHLACRAEAEAARWDRSQRRLPHNRSFKRRRGGKVVREPVAAGRMIFEPFFELKPAAPGTGLPDDARVVWATALRTAFYADHRSARRPEAEPAAVAPMNLSGHEVDALLEAIELWGLRR